MTCTVLQIWKLAKLPLWNIIQIHVAMNFIHYETECSFHARIFFLLFSLQAEIVQADPLQCTDTLKCKMSFQGTSSYQPLILY